MAAMAATADRYIRSLPQHRKTAICPYRCPAADLLLCVCLLPTHLQVYSLMNLAYAYHEIISDYVTVALMWFESGCVPACRVPACIRSIGSPLLCT